MRYVWYIQTGNEWFAGTDSNIYLSLNGLDAVMKEVLIDDPSSDNDWERGALNSGVIETEDLGELQSGLLRSDHSGAPPTNWKVEWIKIMNEEDGREWTAGIGKWSDWADTKQGFRLKFTRTADGQFEQIQKRKAEAARKKAADDQASADKAKREAADAEKARKEQEKRDREQAEQEAFDEELSKADKELERELLKARKEAEVAKKRAELDKLRGTTSGGSTPTPGGGGAAFRTVELYGVMGGARVPLTSAVSMAGGMPQVQPGARVMVGEVPADGFGLAGVPGRWSAYYAGRSPAEFGLDADKGVLASDGSRGWALTATFLSQIFGAGWRAVIY
jgi:hypothetical protein